MNRLTYRDKDWRARMTHEGKVNYCSTQATADKWAKYEEMLIERGYRFSDVPCSESSGVHHYEKAQICELARRIPAEELRLKLSYGISELDPSFLCFDENYIPVAEYVPHEFTIIDLGCYQAAQCYFFADFARYIGVDDMDKISSLDYRPPLRFCTKNTEHYVQDIHEFLSQESFDCEQTYFIMSAVPGIGADVLDKHHVINYFWSYPGKTPVARGIRGEKILEGWRRINSSKEAAVC